MRYIYLILLTSVLCYTNAFPANAYNNIKFVDVTVEAGIVFQHVDGRSGEKFLLETLGSRGTLSRLQS